MHTGAYHVFTRDDGATTLERTEIELSPVEGVAPNGVFHAAFLGERAAGIVVFEPGFESGYHNTPAETWMLVMAGSLELTVSDGTSVVLEPGDAVLFDDAAGGGHTSRVLGDRRFIVATAGFSS